MNRAVSNLLGWLDRPEHEIWAMATCNPARAACLADVGVMDVGANANLVLWALEQGTLQAVRTWVRGVPVYEREPALT
jgi:N-acetylglucosamine-6-phosphate deacetylase